MTRMYLTMNNRSEMNIQMQEWIANTVLHLCFSPDEMRRDPSMIWKLVNAYEQIGSATQRKKRHIQFSEVSETQDFPQSALQSM